MKSPLVITKIQIHLKNGAIFNVVNNIFSRQKKDITIRKYSIVVKFNLSCPPPCKNTHLTPHIPRSQSMLMPRQHGEGLHQKKRVKLLRKLVINRTLHASALYGSGQLTNEPPASHDKWFEWTQYHNLHQALLFSYCCDIDMQLYLRVIV